jgi:hypothetical protein
VFNQKVYGSYEASEFFVEAVLEYLSSKNPRPIAKMVGGFIGYYLKK